MSATSFGTSPLSVSPENEMMRRWRGCCRRQVSYSLIMVMILYFLLLLLLRVSTTITKGAFDRDFLLMWNYVSCKILVLSSCVIDPPFFPLFLIRVSISCACICVL